MNEVSKKMYKFKSNGNCLVSYKFLRITWLFVIKNCSPSFIASFVHVVVY